MRVEIGKAPASLRREKRLILLRLHRAEIVFSRVIDGARLRMFDTEIQTEPVPNLERIASENIKTGTLLFEIETILETESLRQFGRIDPEEFTGLVISKTRVEEREARCERPIEQVRLGKAELILRLAGFAPKGGGPRFGATAERSWFF